MGWNWQCRELYYFIWLPLDERELKLNSAEGWLKEGSAFVFVMQKCVGTFFLLGIIQW